MGKWFRGSWNRSVEVCLSWGFFHRFFEYLKIIWFIFWLIFHLIYLVTEPQQTKSRAYRPFFFFCAYSTCDECSKIKVTFLGLWWRSCPWVSWAVVSITVSIGEWEQHLRGACFTTTLGAINKGERDPKQTWEKWVHMGAGGMVHDEPRSKPSALNEYSSQHKLHCTSLLLLTTDLNFIFLSSKTYRCGQNYWHPW